MIVEKKFLSKLKEFGLNSYESKVWVALLSRGVSSAGELSDIANVPRSRSYDVLESLEKKGFVVMKLGKPLKYIAVPPIEVIDRVKKRIQEEVIQEEKILEELKNSEILQELGILHQQGFEGQDPTEITASIKGRYQIFQHIESQIKTAQSSIFIATSEQGLIQKSTALSKQLKKAKERGVKITLKAPLSNINSKSFESLAPYVDFQNHHSNDARICIIDGTNITLFITEESEIHPSYDLAIWLQSKTVAKTLMSALN